jgi:uncharacterized repeat protein (TIGR01451 family)
MAVQLGYDLSISLATTAWRRGFTNETVIQVSNLGTESAENAVVSLILPEEAYFVSADLSYSSPSAKTFVWDLGTIKPGVTRTIQLMYSIGLEATTEQILLINASTEASGTDLDHTNNSLSEEVEVVGAIDPNDILVSPRGEGPQGFISKEQWLTYTIRFENVGTYKATYVFLENQLPEGLDISSFEVISSSHNYNYTLTEQGKLEVNYRYIDLPAAMDDSIGAHGYFKYKIKPKKSVAGGTQIANHAKIYFDFEEPIITNTVISTIKYQGSHEVKNLKIFPNPVSDWVQIILDEEFYRVTDPKVIAHWVIQDYNARSIHEGNGNFEARTEINISHLPTGIYILRAFDQSGQVYVGKMLKK